MTRPTLALPFLLPVLARLQRRRAPTPPGASTGDAPEAWLSDVADLADLERRLRRLERGRPDRFGPLPP